MISRKTNRNKIKPIRILLADDSPVLRRVYRTIFDKFSEIEVIGEANNGIVALDLVLRLRPDVILLDVEMPLMDGMTTLQHLMIHTPTPTIMFSSLSNEGTARCFDALKYGAVDFVSKASFFKDNDKKNRERLLFEKVLAASRVVVDSVDPMQLNGRNYIKNRADEEVIFCEECGTKQVKNAGFITSGRKLNCSNCGDEIRLDRQERHHRMGFVTVIGAGRGGYSNLLRIIPRCEPEMGGALVVVLHEEPENIDSFVKYLNAISVLKVRRGVDGLTVEGGNCYLVAASEQAVISPYTGSYTLQIASPGASTEEGGIDTMMASVGLHLRGHSAGILLSGSVIDGRLGIEKIAGMGGRCLFLAPSRCLYKTMSKKTDELKKVTLVKNESDLAETIKEMHLGQKISVITA